MAYEQRTGNRKFKPSLNQRNLGFKVIIFNRYMKKVGNLENSVLD
jgi:hypothetical protein